MHTLFKLNSVCFVLLYSCLSFAGGPLVLEGSNGNTPVNYLDADNILPGTNVILDVENGDLGTLSNAAANALVQQAFNLWNNVPTATINLSLNSASINLDVDESNYQDYIPIDSGATPKPNDALNPLIYDDDGSIIDAFFGVQNGTILGFAASSVFIGSDHFEEGFIVINGSVSGYTDAEYVLLFAHEIGHFVGLDHSQSDIDNQESQFGTPANCSTSSSSKYPLMYPIACRMSDSLHTDDISAVSALYPEATINDDLGILEGRLTTDTGKALLGANIWVENNTTFETYSIVSDYLRQGTGFYRLHLPAGSYTLHANSINTEFFSGSGVGPYSNTPSDASFIDPHPITSFTYQDDAGADIIITIDVNQTVVVDFSSIDISPPTIPPDTVPKDEGDSLSDVFGATSPFTLLLTLTALIVIRRTNK